VKGVWGGVNCSEEEGRGRQGGEEKREGEPYERGGPINRRNGMEIDHALKKKNKLTHKGSIGNRKGIEEKKKPLKSRREVSPPDRISSLSKIMKRGVKLIDPLGQHSRKKLESESLTSTEEQEKTMKKSQKNKGNGEH